MNNQNLLFNKRLNELKAKMHEMTKEEVALEIKQIKSDIKNYLIKEIDVDYQEVNIINQAKSIINPNET